MSQVNKSTNELAVDLVIAWLDHEKEVAHESGGISVKGQTKSVKEVAQAYLDFSYTLVNGKLPANLESQD
ncbi:hypothetical protein [Enterococcus faecium]|uniref:hypothetical protein n=1 Tax=Enterococcus faecium TaxID=1352 RepID=UPI002ECAF86E|nr:hypothetical protein [Enterococcus faecium]